MIRKFLILGLLIQSAVTWAADDVDYDAIEKQLQKGWVTQVHAAVPLYQLYLATWRDPKDFFNMINFPMVPATPEVSTAFKTLNRHDKIKVTGKFIKQEAPVNHIQVTKIEILAKYKDESNYTYEVKLPDDLKNKTEAIFKIHAVVHEGKVLAAEYKDAICPVLSKDGSYFKDIYRGDKVKIKFKIREHKKGPTHLELAEDEKEPVKVLMSIKEQHKKELKAEGLLVQYPKSPAVSLNIFAIQITDADGFKLDYSLVSNATGPKIKKVEEKWTEKKKEVVRDRNKWILPTVKVKVKGIVDVTDANQTPQLLIDKDDDIQFE